ncbi:ybbC [Symbiodinium microadriaticum]|nr:ybbC [Symbiodinium microadriaticum]
MAAEETLDVVAVFGPEHGFRGDKQAETGDEIVYIDKATRLPVFSAYNMDETQITKVMVDLNITAVVVDMQDVGVRLYTFIWTLYDTMKAAADKSLNEQVSFIILDRPNPLGGELVDGPLLNMTCCSSGYGRFPITHIHGLTIAELASLFNSAIGLPSTNIIVVPMLRWLREMRWGDTGLLWVPPSPNVPTPNTAIAYGATVFLEATTVAEGRGTTTPFELFGAPFLNAERLASRLNRDFYCSSPLAGLQGQHMQPQSTRSRFEGGESRNRNVFRAAYFQPTFSKYNGTTVPGAQWFDSSSRCAQDTVSLPTTSIPHSKFGAMSTFAEGTAILIATKDLSLPADSFQWDGSWFGHPGTQLIDQYAGTPLYRELIDSGESWQRVVEVFAHDVWEFQVVRKSVLLY